MSTTEKVVLIVVLTFLGVIGIVAIGVILYRREQETRKRESKKESKEEKQREIEEDLDIDDDDERKQMTKKQKQGSSEMKDNNRNIKFHVKDNNGHKKSIPNNYDNDNNNVSILKHNSSKGKNDPPNQFVSIEVDTPFGNKDHGHQKHHQRNSTSSLLVPQQQRTSLSESTAPSIHPPSRIYHVRITTPGGTEHELHPIQQLGHNITEIDIELQG